MRVRQLTIAALLVAIGTAASHLVYIPVGVAKCYPVQHAINVIAGVLLGPWFAGAIAFLISLLRNLLGTGSLLAFPGSMIGAILAGIVYRQSRSRLGAVLGEVMGTGVLGALLAYPVARFALQKEVAALFFVVPFLASTLGGSAIGYLMLGRLETRQLPTMQSARDAECAGR